MSLRRVTLIIATYRNTVQLTAPAIYSILSRRHAPRRAAPLRRAKQLTSQPMGAMIMRICEISIESITAYSQSKMVDNEIFPKKEKEGADEYDKRLWREKATYDATGQVCIPAMSLKMATDEAVKRLNLSIPGRGKSTYSKFFVAGQICESDVPIGVRKDDLEYIDIWANADGVRGSGKRVRRRFPYIQSWAGIARFAILDDVIPATVFEKAFTEAGRLVGIGRFRPEKGGFLGRFRVGGFKWSEI